MARSRSPMGSRDVAELHDSLDFGGRQDVLGQRLPQPWAVPAPRPGCAGCDSRRVIHRNHIRKGTRRECCERKLIGSPFFLR